MTTAVAASPALTVKRYPFPVPEWCRRIWASEEARELWEPRLHAIGVAWEATERASVGVVREACRQNVQPESLPEMTQKAAERGLELIVLNQAGSGASYQSGPVAIEDAASWGYQVALVTRASAVEFLAAWRDSDDDTLGALLGYPACCRDFFQRVWVDENWIDTTWPMVAGEANRHEVSVSGPVECNILLRWLGVRWVPHLPCSFDCEDTAAFGQSMREVMERGHPQEAAWMDELLDSPVQWSALHGIAEIKTPVVTVSSKTDATAETLVLRRKGSTYPEAGARGLKFPYHRDPESLRPEPVDLWTDNGFASREAMETAHGMLLSELGDEYGAVVDLGCGNGLLLSLVSAGRRVGIESDPDKARRAGQRLDRVIVGDCTDPDVIAEVVAGESPDVLIAQRHRNPPESLPEGVRVLSYSYEADDMGAEWR